MFQIQHINKAFYIKRQHLCWHNRNSWNLRVEGMFRSLSAIFPSAVWSLTTLLTSGYWISAQTPPVTGTHYLTQEHTFIYYKKFYFILFIYFWLCWVFAAARGLSLVAVNGGYSSLQCEGFSSQWLFLLWSMGSRHAGFSSCGTRAQ